MTVKQLASYQINSAKTSYSNNIAAANAQRLASAGASRVQSPSGVNVVNRANSESLQFLNQYKAKMDGLKSAADKIRLLSSDSVWNDLKVSSTDETVASYGNSFGSVRQRAEYDIDVTQLAKRQISTIDAPAGGFLDGSFNIDSTYSTTVAGNTNSASIQITTTDGSGAARSEHDIMNDIVSQINGQDSLGVKASLVDAGGGKYSIQIEGSETGAAKNFSISVGTGGGADVALNTTQASQDLKYSVNGGPEASSGSNRYVQIDPTKNSDFHLNFNKVGSTKITADVDKEKLAKYTEQFVDAYNKTVDFLVDNAHRGTGVSDALDRMMQSPISKDTMKNIGLQFGQDGKITYDADKFKKAMDDDILKVYDALADNYSIADSIYQKADKASRTSAASLLNNSNLQNNNGSSNGGGQTIIINNYYNNYNNYNPFGFPSFLNPGSIFFNTRA